MSIFNINFKQLWQQLTPPKLRKSIELAWGEALMSPMDNNNQLFNDYLSGSTYNFYTTGYTYSASNRVVYTDNGVYENLTGCTNIPPTDVNNWININGSYVGAIERSRYNAQKYLFEFALNRYFQVTGTTRQSIYGPSYNNIYIENLSGGSASMLMGQTGPYSSNLYNDEVFSTAYLTNSYSTATSDYIVWVPNYIYTANSYSRIDAFVSHLNIAGMTYQIKNY